MKISPLTLLAAAAAFSLSLSAQTIELNGNSGDIFFLYQSQTDTWHTVFRAKGTTGQPTTTDATGLTNPFPSFTGVSGATTVLLPANNGDTGDYQFSSLRVNAFTTTQQLVGSTAYWLSRASGSPFYSAGTASDLGLRTRLREDEAALGIGSNTAADQFASFNLTLNVAASTFNGSPLAGNADVSLLFWDGFNNPAAMLDTAAAQNTASLGTWGHIHRNWGFSQQGEYNLVFDLQGVGGTYGSSASTGTASVTFNVIPEPSTLMLLFGGVLGLLSARKLRNRSHD